jgi:hypothetical protein
LWWRKRYLDLLDPLVYLLRVRLPTVDGDHLGSSLLNQTSCVPLPLAGERAAAAGGRGTRGGGGGDSCARRVAGVDYSIFAFFTGIIGAQIGIWLC